MYEEALGGELGSNQLKYARVSTPVMGVADQPAVTFLRRSSPLNVGELGGTLRKSPAPEPFNTVPKMLTSLVVLSHV